MKSTMNFIESTMKKISRVFVTALLLFSCAAFAIDLHSAKSQGLVGETDSGYLAALNNTAEVAGLVREVNAQRKDEYQRIAKQNGIDVSAVEKLAAKKAIEKTPSGQYVRVNGTWRQK